MPGIRGMKGEKIQGSEWMFFVLTYSSCHLTMAILHLKYLNSPFLLVLSWGEKKVVSVVNNNYFPLMFI